MPYIGQRPSKGDENNFKILDDISSYTLTFDGSDASVVSAANDTITSLTHRFVQGQRVTYNKGGGTVIPGLSDGVYYIIKNDHNTIKLATSASNAANGTAVNITNVGGGSSHTLNVAFDGVNTKFKATHTNGQKARITRSAQLVISINGVIQQPHDTATPSTGFGFDLDGTIVFSQAPVSTDEYWAHVLTNNNVTFDISNNDIDNFTGDGSTREFNLSKTPPDNRNVLVTIDGVIQYPNDPDGTVRSYSVVENVLTFVTAPDSGVEIQVRHIGFAGSTSGSGGVTNFYGRTGSVVLKNTDNVTVNDAAVTGNLTVDGNLTANGDFTTLNTTLREVELLRVDAQNDNVAAGIITQRGTGDILNLFDNNSEVLTVTDGGQVGINSTSPSNGAILDIGAPTTKTGGLDATVSIASTENKTYPTASSFSVTLGLKQEFEVGGTQTIDATTPGGFNFITGITNWMRKKNGNVQDVERAYYSGINQNFSWSDANTLKQYVGISDSVTYFGNDANGRTTSYLGAKDIVVNPGAGKTQTINIARGDSLNFRNFDAGTTKTVNVTNWQGFNPNFSFFTLGGSIQGTTTNAAFYDTASSWGFNGSGSISYTVTNLYGLRLRPPTSSTGLTVTNNYGISQEWSSAKNYFAGKVGVGVNDPEAYQSSSNNLVVGNTGDAAGITIRSGSSNGGYITFANAGSGSGLYKSRIAYDHQGDKLSFSTNGTNRLFITGNAATNGRVGVNTISPNAPLDVFHNGSATYKDMIMARSHSGAFAVECSDIDAANPTWTLRTYTLEDMIISPGGSGVNNHKVFIRASDGHIGINTTVPNKLVTIKAISPVVRIEAADSSDKRLDFMVSNVGIATISAEQSNQQLSFRTTGGEAVRIKADGKVGIGTDNPGRLLTLFANDQPVFQITNNTSGTASTRGSIFYQMSGTTTLAIDNQGTGTGGNIHFMSAGNNTLKITSGGLVQTLTRSASERRMILAGSPSNASFNIEAHDGATGTNAGTIQGELGLYYNDGSTLSDTATIKFERGSGAPDGAMTLFTNNTERVRINSSGKFLVGIHTTSEAYTWSPMARFAIQTSGDASSIHFGQRYGGSADPAIMMLRTGGSTAWHHHVGRIYTNYEPSIYFQTSFAAAPGAENFQTHMVMKHNHGVGIGTNSPLTELHVHSDTFSDITIHSERTSGNIGGLNFRKGGATSGIMTAQYLVDVSGNHYFYSQGSQRLKSASDGDLTISGADNAELKLKAGTTSGNGIIYFLNNSGTSKGVINYDTDDNFMFFKTNGTASSNERLRIDSSGRLIVGGGTHAGGSALVVKGGGVNTYSTVGLFGATATPSNNAIFAQIRFGSGTTQVGATINAKADADWGSLNDYPTRLEFYTAPDGSGTVVERMRISKDGYVSISSDGTTDGLLTIKGDSDARTTPSIRLLDGSDTREVSISNQSGDLIMSTHGTDNAAHGEIKIFDSGLIHLNTDGSNNRLAITTEGRVGINQNNPDGASLHIGNSNSSTGSNIGLLVGTISANRYLTINHFGGQQNVYNMKIRVNDNGLIPMLDLGNPYGSQNHGTQIKFSGYNDNEVAAIQVINTANSSSTAVDMAFRTGGTDERLRIHSNGVLSTSNVADSVFKFNIDDSIGWWNTNTGLAPNTTRTWTITNINYGGARILIGGGDGNYQRAGAVIEVVGTMWANNKSYYHNETIKNSSGASISTTYNNASIEISVTAGSNWWYYSMSIESHRRSSGANFPTVTVS